MKLSNSLDFGKTDGYSDFKYMCFYIYKYLYPLPAEIVNLG